MIHPQSIRLWLCLKYAMTGYECSRTTLILDLESPTSFPVMNSKYLPKNLLENWCAANLCYKWAGNINIKRFWRFLFQLALNIPSYQASCCQRCFPQHGLRNVIAFFPMNRFDLLLWPLSRPIDTDQWYLNWSGRRMFRGSKFPPHNASILVFLVALGPSTLPSEKTCQETLELFHPCSYGVSIVSNARKSPLAIGTWTSGSTKTMSSQKAGRHLIAERTSLGVVSFHLLLYLFSTPTFIFLPMVGA